MVKLSTSFVFPLLVALPVLGSTLGCSGAKPSSAEVTQAPGTAAKVPAPRVAFSSKMLDHPLAFTASASPVDVHKLWTQQIPGLMTDLSVSRDGSAILLATIPNPEGGEGPRETGHGLSRYDRGGRRLWHIELEGAVKSMALSDDGKLALVSAYDNTISAIDPRGKIVWKVEGMCKPVPIGKRFLCYHDDDAEANVAFDVYTDLGRKVLYYPISRDVLALKVSDDQRNTAIALEGGQVVLFGPDFHSLWQRKVNGEVLDLAVSSGDHPRVSALFNTGAPKGPDQGITFLDEEGKVIGQATPSSRVEQLEAIPGGRGVAVYGNGARGQFVAFYELPFLSTKLVETAKPSVIPEKWRHGDAHTAEFSSGLIVTRDLVILGFEDIAEDARHSHLIAFDLDGGLKWNLPLVTEEGAYLYAHGFAPVPSLISVGTDDGYLSAFQLKGVEKKGVPVAARPQSN